MTFVKSNISKTNSAIRRRRYFGIKNQRDISALKFGQKMYIYSARREISIFLLGDKFTHPFSFMSSLKCERLWCDETLFRCRVASRREMRREIYPESWDGADLRGTKIEGSRPSRFIMIFQRLPTKWMRLRVFYDSPGRVNACAWHSQFNVNLAVCKRQKKKRRR